MGSWRATLCGLLTAILLCTSFVSAAAGAEEYQFDIPAQPADTALQTLARQSGVQVAFSPDQVRGVITRDVSGRMTVEQALSRMFAGSKLRSRTTDKSVTVFSEQEAAAAPPPVSYAQSLADAQSTEIIVTGSRTASRTIATSPSPIDVLSSNDIQKTGKQTVREILNSLLPSATTSGAGAGASFAVKTAALRGLGGDQTLVLVNGKRRHASSIIFINGNTQSGQSPTDLDLIPVSAIDHVEVLRDGAAAQYGSDAIAGVVNVILKSGAQGGSVGLLGGIYGDGQGKTGQGMADVGFELGSKGGFVHLAADLRSQGHTEHGGLNTDRLYPLVNGQLDPREATADRHTGKPGLPYVQNYQFAYNGELPLSDAVKLYSSATYSRRDSRGLLTFRNPAASNNIIELYPDGYYPQLIINTRDMQGTVGVRGDDFFGWAWDVSTTISRDEETFSEDTTLNPSMGPASPKHMYLGQLISTEWTTNIDLVRKFETGWFEKPLGVAVGIEHRANTYRIPPGEPASYINGNFRYTSGPLAGALEQQGSQGVSGFTPAGSRPHSRDNYSGYVDLSQQILPNWEVSIAGRFEHYTDFGDTESGKFSTRYELFKGLAIRGTVSNGFRAPSLAQEHYSSSSTIGVRDPVTQQLVLQPVQALPVDTPAARALGAKPLKPETSTNYSVGLVAQPADRLTITLDLYQIDIKDRVLETSTLSGNAVRAALTAAGLDPNLSGFYFANGGDTRTRGLDLVVNYSSDFGKYGFAKWTLAGNLNRTIFERVTPPPPQLAAAGLLLIDRQRQGDLSAATPKSKILVGVDWALEPVNATIRATRFGSVVATSATGPAFDDHTDPKTIVDVDLAYDVNERLRFAVGANNVFNTYPSKVQPLNRGTAGFALYNTYSPFGFSGGFYYARASYQF